MLVSFFRLLSALSVGAVVLASSGQTATTTEPRPCRTAGCMSHQAWPQAYNVEFSTVSVQTLADGTTISRESKEVVVQDSQGRSLRITTESLNGPERGEFVHGHIENPLDNTSINWDSHGKKVRVLRLPPPEQRIGCWRSDSGRETISYGQRPDASVLPKNRTGLLVSGTGTLVETTGRVSKPEPQREDLGTTTIQGFEATGERWTTVIPVGEAGNDRPITTTTEIWRSSGFPMPLREIHNDPRSGKRTREVVSLTIGEPDLALFQPPEGYEVVNEEMHEIACQQ